jgi:hypothetical protein
MATKLHAHGSYYFSESYWLAWTETHIQGVGKDMRWNGCPNRLPPFAGFSARTDRQLHNKGDVPTELTDVQFLEIPKVKRA